MCGTFAQVAYDMYSGRHKKTSVSVNGPTYMGSNIFARILSNSVYTLFGFVAVIDGGTGGSEVSLPGFICSNFATPIVCALGAWRSELSSVAFLPRDFHGSQ